MTTIFWRQLFAMASDEEILTITELSDHLRVHPTTIYRLLREGRIPGFRVGSAWRFNRTSIEKWEHGEGGALDGDRRRSASPKAARQKVDARGSSPQNRDFARRPIRDAFDKRAANLIPNRQMHVAESFAPMPTKYTEVKGYATYYYYRGATTLPDVVPDFSRGREILFIHGAGSNGHTWHRQGEAIGKNHSPVVLDLPGHGRSAEVRDSAPCTTTRTSSRRSSTR